MLELWDRILKDYDALVYIPMSSGLSSSCETAVMLAQDYGGRVQVVNNQRISVTLRQSALDAQALAAAGRSAAEIKALLEQTKFTGRLLKAAITKYMAHRKEVKVEKRRKRETPVVHRGKQTVKQLTQQNQGVSNIDIQDKEIRQFERIARKYGVD